MRTLAAALIFTLSTTVLAATAELDLASAEGFAATCGALPREPSQLTTMQLSYTLNSQDFKAHSIELVDPAGMKRANRLMVRGFQTSEAMRRAVLAEKDDDHAVRVPA